jgi:exopolysaccharide biosynthesis polyprenyl glycosylphosphotransferase
MTALDSTSGAALPGESSDLAVSALPLQRSEIPQVRVSTSAPSALGDTSRTRWMASYARVVMLADAVVGLLAAWAALAAVNPRPGHLATALVVILVPLGWVGVTTLARGYEPRFLGEGSDDYRRTLDLGLKLMAVLGVAALITQAELGRALTLVAFPVLLVGTMLVRFVGHRVQASARRHGVARHRALVVGTERATAEMMRRLTGRDDHSFQVVGALVDRSQQDVIEGVPVVGTSTDVRRALDLHDADTLIVAAWSPFSQQELRHLSWALEDSKVDVLVSPNLTDVAGTRISVRPVVGLPLLHVERPEFTGSRRVAKGLFDRIVALVALVLLSPVIAGLALAVRLDSRGPAFFTQTRVGRNGRTFRMVKLRSMHVNADDVIADLRDSNEGAGVLFKMKEDPRITRVGSLLRRTSLDELPQLFNVLSGSMSLVGPRPPLPDEVAQYGDDVHRRLLVKPGMTGLWQVSGRSDLDWDESVRLDLYYVENWSFLMDVSIISQTFRAVIAARGAY